MNVLTKSVSRKLTLLIVAVSAIIVLFACTTFIALDVAAFRSYKTQQTRALGKVFAINASAVMHFGQPEMGTELLAPLRSHPTITYACLLDNRGHLFAEFKSDADVPGVSVKSTKFAESFTSDGYLTVTLPIEEDGERLGTLQLRSTLADVNQQVKQNVLVATGIVIGCLVFSVVLAYFFQRSVSRPILQLAATADRISREGDYSLRVNTNSNDELGVLFCRFNEMLEHIEEGERQLMLARNELEQRVAERTEELSLSNAELQVQIGEREATARRLAETHEQLTLAARQAGMAEIASGVLHNVGNVLNSVNVSTNLVYDRMKHSRILALNKAVDLMNDHGDDLAIFITYDEQGKLLPDYLNKVADSLVNERDSILQELTSLRQCVEHMKEIISKQQSLARFGGTRESIELEQLIEDAVNMNDASLNRHDIQLIREYDDLPDITTDRHKVLQILVNLIGNAKAALGESPNPDKQITLRLIRREARAIIEVSDNGVGIASKNLEKIFQHGFTTKKNGHGFGLHSSALAAGEIGGSLSARSDGPGTGATFILQIPVKIEEESTCTM